MNRTKDMLTVNRTEDMLTAVSSYPPQPDGPSQDGAGGYDFLVSCIKHIVSGNVTQSSSNFFVNTMK